MGCYAKGPLLPWNTFGPPDGQQGRATSMATFEKREKEKRRLQQQEEKRRRKQERKANASDGGLDSMMAYVDENGRITSTPPDPNKKKVPIDASEIEVGIPRRTEEEEAAKYRVGRVDFFDDTKGFGFIKEEGSQERFFVHRTGLLDELAEGDKVSFELERGQKGMNAVRVKKV
jgi:cold shock CspA family protein